MVEKYPVMTKHARKYLSIQGTYTAAERAMSSMNIILDKKRLRMTSALFSKVMFLSDNI